MHKITNLPEDVLEIVHKSARGMQAVLQVRSIEKHFPGAKAKEEMLNALSGIYRGEMNFVHSVLEAIKDQENLHGKKLLRLKSLHRSSSTSGEGEDEYEEFISSILHMWINARDMQVSWNNTKHMLLLLKSSLDIAFEAGASNEDKRLIVENQWQHLTARPQFNTVIKFLSLGLQLRGQRTRIGKDELLKDLRSMMFTSVGVQETSLKTSDATSEELNTVFDGMKWTVEEGGLGKFMDLVSAFNLTVNLP
jgi:hypothetical protein